MGKVFALETFNCLTKGEFYCSARMPTSRFSPEKVRFYRTKHFGSILDKKRETYNAMFGSLKENLEARGLELSPKYMISDFETVIKESFISHFPDVEAKGCAFHYSAAIIKKRFQGTVFWPKVYSLQRVHQINDWNCQCASSLAYKLPGCHRSIGQLSLPTINPDDIWSQYHTNNQSEGMYTLIYLLLIIINTKPNTSSLECQWTW